MFIVFPHRFFYMFHVFSCFFEAPFRDDFLTAFLMEKRHQNDFKNRSPGQPFLPTNLQKTNPSNAGERPGADLFSGIDLFMFFGPLSALFWKMLSPFGSTWALFGSMLGPFSSILGVFWTLLVEFCKK